MAPEPLQANPNDVAAKLEDVAGKISGDMVKYGIIALVVLVAAYIVLRLLKTRRREPPPPSPDLSIDVTALAAEGPPAAGPSLLYYGVSARLVAIVLAPLGRDRELPRADQFPGALDGIVPNLSQVAAAHRPLVRRWTNQLSARGFGHLFFASAKLPGRGGKGTEWCSVAGMFTVEGQPLMAGIVLRTAKPTNLGQRIVAEEAQWLDVLRTRP